MALPLSALSAVLEDRSAETRWPVKADGVPGRALQMRAGSVYQVPLVLGAEVLLTGRAMLMPHDWVNGVGAVQARISVERGDGVSRVVWQRDLYAADRGRPRGFAFELALPTDTRSLSLSVHTPLRLRHRSVKRAIWLRPTLYDPAAPTASPSGADRDTRGAARPSIATLAAADRPLISVLTPVHDPPLEMLREAVESVLTQTYDGWELCLVDDGSRDPQIKDALREYADDPRITLVTHDTARGIARATNTAMAAACGRYLALLDHDDTLTPGALQAIADRIATDPGLDMLYSDEDIVLDGRRVWAHLKPAWSPDTMRTNGYTCHLGVYRRELVEQLSGFRDEFNGSQDVDLILRLMERTDRIAHVPGILYHWRAHANSTAGFAAKPYAYVAARNAIVEHVKRVGLDAEVGFGPPGLYRLAHRVEPQLTVEIVVHAGDPEQLVRAMRNWAEQSHRSWRAVAAVPDRNRAAAALDAAGLTKGQITFVEISPEADPTMALREAAARATAEHIVLMQSPATGLTSDWLARLLGYSAQADVAAAGPVILAPDGRIREAGIALPDGIPLPILHGARSSLDDLFGYGTSVYNVSAVSGVLATPHATYEALGGLRPEHRGLALIDYCLRAGDIGERTVIVPDARVQTTSRPENDLPTIWRLREEWVRSHDSDPYYNRGFRTDRGDFLAAD